ncbi:glycosyltransferase family 4 protein [Thermus sp. SYSU G05001]|uniref:Glycosyltransferase family 4 protein n=1 Tax=Thermus brevis TaxID=2862456 RepID=A0ABS6ZXN0_9DEIN|nr:glycosyltransferase family 4 protein [Thermus brevis]MBW6394803.1 glycosyltransferase family 4 protein [Thermus brevis]
MKVLLLLEAAGGGAGRHVLDLSLGLVKRGLEVHLAYSPLRMEDLFAKHLPRLQEAGVHLLSLPIRREPHPSDLTALGNLLSYARKQGPFDIVHGHSSKGGALARLLGPLIRAKVVYTPHGVTALRGPSLYDLAEKSLAPLTHLAIAVSPWEEEALRKLGYRRVEVVLNGIDPTGFPSRKEARERLGLREEKVVGFVGRFVPEKNPLLALRAFAHLSDPNLKLVMVGDGPLRQEVEKETEALGLKERVILTGALEARKIFPAFDVLLLTSAYEGLPYVVLEALTLSIPIVSAPTPGLGEWLSQHGAFVADKGDPDALKEVLVKALELGKKESLVWKKEWSFKSMVEKTLELYKAIL